MNRRSAGPRTAEREGARGDQASLRYRRQRCTPCAKRAGCSGLPPKGAPHEHRASSASGDPRGCGSLRSGLDRGVERSNGAGSRRPAPTDSRASRGAAFFSERSLSSKRHLPDWAAAHIIRVLSIFPALIGSFGAGLTAARTTSRDATDSVAPGGNEIFTTPSRPTGQTGASGSSHLGWRRLGGLGLHSAFMRARHEDDSEEDADVETLRCCRGRCS